MDCVRNKVRNVFIIFPLVLSHVMNGNSEKIKLYREVDRLKLGEIKSAYIALKRADKVFQEDVKKIKAYLEPPKPEPTEEELKEQRLKFYAEEYKRLQRDGKVLGTTIFYDLIKKEGLETVKLKWLEAILDKFKPETVDKSLINEPQLVKIPKIKKHLGQHFLKDLEVARRIADSLALDGRTSVLEIGPGMGVLTQFLLQNPLIDLTAIELDGESVQYLHQHYPQLNLS